MKKIILILISLVAFMCITTSVYAAKYRYDDLNRLIEVVYDNGTTITYTYDPAGNITNVVTTYGGTQRPKSLLEVSVVGNGSVRIDAEIVSLPLNYKYSYEYGTRIKLTAVAKSDSKFAYWEDARTGSIISIVPVYETIMGTGENVKAVFNKMPTEATEEFTVVFRNRSGMILKSTNVAKNSAAVPPDAPSLVGYRFIDWDKDYSNVVSDMVVSPIFERLPDKYTITVVGGKLSTGNTRGEYQFDMSVSVVANDAPNGKKFSHWEQDGMRISIESKYSFFMPKKDTVLTAVYVDNAAIIDVKPFITLSQDVLKDSNEKTMIFTANRNVPKGYSLIESGVILLRSNTGLNGLLTLETDNILRGKINNNSTNQFYVRKLNTARGDTWYGRAYLIYQDSDSKIVTVYSDVTAKGVMD